MMQMPGGFGGQKPSDMPKDMPENIFEGFIQNTGNYITQVSYSTNLNVIGQLILVGIALTLISSLAAVLFIMRYEPLKILSNRD